MISMNEKEMEKIFGGMVYLDSDAMILCCTLLKKDFELVNCSADEARTVLEMIKDDRRGHARRL